MSPLFFKKRQRGDKQILGWAAVLFLVTVLPRLVVYDHFPPITPLAQETLPIRWYFEALRHDFFGLVFHTAFKPPLTLLIHAVIAGLFGADLAYELNLFLLVTFAMDIAAFFLLYATALRLRVKPWIAAALIMVYSLYLLPFECWRAGMHYDHYTTVFASLFLFALVRDYQIRKTRSLVLVIVASALMAAQSTVNTYVGVVAIVAWGLTRILEGRRLLLAPVDRAQSRSRPWREIGRLALSCAGIGLVVFGLKLKNAALGIGPVISNAAGQNLMLVVHHAYEFDAGKVRELILRSDVPDWYLWCYDHAIGDLFAANGKQKLFGQIYGHCAPGTRPDAKSWPFNFEPLIDHFRETGPARLLALVEKDQEDQTNRKRLLTAISPEMAPRFMAVYGAVSERVAWQLIRSEPRRFWKTFLLQHDGFRHDGPFFPATCAPPFLRPFVAQARLESICYFWSTAYRAMLWFWPIAIGVLGLGIFSRLPRVCWYVWSPIGLLAVPLQVLAIMFSAFSFGENDRYFIQGMPYLVLIVSCGVSFAFTLLESLLQARREVKKPMGGLTEETVR